MRRLTTGFAIAFGAVVSIRGAAAQNTDSAALVAPASHPDCGACLTSLSVGLHSRLAVPRADTGRPLAIEYSDAYAVRLKIHQIGSYVALPLFAAEYYLGEKILTDERNNRNVPGYRAPDRGAHSAVATGLGVVFASNTITGVWNLIESRRDPAGRARRWIHSIAMLVADGGFVATAQAAGAARRTDAGADQHRNLAIGSLGLATASAVMMWLWKD